MNFLSNFAPEKSNKLCHKTNKTNKTSKRQWRPNNRLPPESRRLAGFPQPIKGFAGF